MTCLHLKLTPNYLDTYASWKPDPSALYTNHMSSQLTELTFKVTDRRNGSSGRKGNVDSNSTKSDMVSDGPATSGGNHTPLTPPHSTLLSSPSLPQDPSLRHPRDPELILTAMMLSGDPMKTESIHQRLPNFYFTHGGRTQTYNLSQLPKHCCQFVHAGKCIHFNQYHEKHTYCYFSQS